MPPKMLFDEYGNPVIDPNDPANNPMDPTFEDADLPVMDDSAFDQQFPPLEDFGPLPDAPSVLESLPETGMSFNTSVLAVQTEEEYDALAPELKEALDLIDSGVEFSEDALARFVLKRREELQKAQTPEGQQAALMAEAGIKTIPPGYELKRNSDGEPVLRVTPGGPVARQRIVYNQSVKTASGTVLEDAAKAMELLNSSGRMAAGVGGLLSDIPESDARQLRAYISSIQGNVGVDQLIKIKQTGAGLGQVPQSQLDLLSRLLGNLDQMQKPAELMDVLKRIDRIYTGIVDLADKEIQELSGQPAAASEQPAAQSNPTRQVNGVTWELGDDGKWRKQRK
jgi:hypothetical protein